MKKSRLLSLAGVICLVPLMLLAQDGKLRGRVTDQQTGEALVGANVLIDGTTLGAAADVNGDYIILSVPPGVYTVRVTYIGYAPFAMSNIRVSSITTTTQDFQLTSSTVQVQGVEIVAERELIQRNTTNTVRLATTETIERLPFRGVDNILALQAGVVKQDDKLYVRGGRAGETAYFVDGANVTNPFLNAANVNIIQEAIEELAIQSGGFSAEFGGANSAIVRTSVRTGGSNLRVSLDYQTDDFARPGQTFLGTTAFGYRNAVLTVGGPIPYVAGAKFFIAGQQNYMRDKQQVYITPFRFEGLTSDGFGGRAAGGLLPENGTVEYKRNYLYNNSLETNTLQGTVSYDMNPLKFRLTGSYVKTYEPAGGSWPATLANYFRLRNGRSMMTETTSGFVNFRTTHVLSVSTFYEIGISFTRRNNRTYDEDFGDNWQLYTDSIANQQKGYTGFLRRFSGPLAYSTINGFTFNDPNSPNNNYSKNKQSSISGVIDLTSQISSNWELKVGGRIDSWVMRTYRINNIEAANVFLYGLYGTQLRSFASSEERKVLLARNGNINFYGYDVDGNEVDAGFDEPRRPLFASAYLQNKFEYRDVILNLGVRYEMYDTKNMVPPDPTGASGFNESLDFIDESQLVKKDPEFYLLPRISFSFPASDRTVFYAQFGKYVQLPELQRLFAGNFILSRNISPMTRAAWGTAGGFPPSFMVVPERTTQYEIGLRQMVADNFAFTLTGFYKNVKDQLQYNKYPSMETPLYVAWRNEDFSSTRGIELTLELRRTQRLSARVNYMLSDARGTASDSYEWYGPVSDVTINSRFPVFVNPLTFNQSHRGSVSLDYRFPKGDGGPILEGTGLNFILTFNSGHNYTKILNAFGASVSPWMVGVQSSARRKPTEPINESSTPWVVNIDLNFSKALYFLGSLTAEVYVNVLNLLNSKQVLNVYETTGTAEDDGWLGSPQSKALREVPIYTEFYRTINLENRWTYLQRKSADIYGTPRQIRIGVKLDINP